MDDMLAITLRLRGRSGLWFDYDYAPIGCQSCCGSGCTTQQVDHMLVKLREHRWRESAEGGGELAGEGSRAS